MISINATIISDGVRLGKELLNSGDEFIVEIGVVPVKGGQPDVKDVKARIAGVTEITLFKVIGEKEEEKGFFQTKNILLILAQLLLGVFAASVVFSGVRQRQFADELLTKQKQAEDELLTEIDKLLTKQKELAGELAQKALEVEMMKREINQLRGR